MKKKIITLLLFISAFAMIGIESVHATNGPASEAYIELFKDADDYGVIYNEGVVDNKAINGATYDKSTNTLTLNNLKSSYELIIYYMGDDFKLNLVGDNEIALIYLDASYWSTTLNITGNGSLTINKNRASETSIAIINGKIVVEENAALKLYSPETFEEYEDFIPHVIAMISSNIEDGYEVIKFKNGQDVVISSGHEWYQTATESIPGFGFKDSDSPINYTIVEKASKKYGMYTSGTNYIVTGSEIKYDGINEEYFIDNSDEKENIVYSSLNEITSNGYVVTEEIVNITKEIVYLNFWLFLDENGKEYAEYTEVFPDDREDIDYLYDITEETITLANGRTYTILKINNSLDIDELTPKYGIGYLDTYEHYIYRSSLEILPNTYEFIEGANQTYIMGQKGLKFKIQAFYSFFENGGKVYVDGKEITDYTSEEGSTIINLSKEYLSSLDEGEHTLKVVFNNGESSTTKFIVSKASNPNTGDNIILWICIAIVSVIILIGIGLILRKKLITSNKEK